MNETFGSKASAAPLSGLRALAQLLSAAALLGASISAGAVTYKFTELLTLGGSSSIAYGINNSGQVVGYSYTSGNATNHATLWNSSAPTDLGTLDGTTTSIAFAINDSGQVVGTSRTAGGAVGYAALWNGVARTNLGSLGGVASATGINDAGQVVGYSGNLPTFWNGVGTPLALSTLGGTVGGASGINKAGQIVGSSTLNGATDLRATLWTDGTPANLGFGSLTDAVAGYGNGINDVGQVAGAVQLVTDTVISHAVLWDRGSVIDLRTLGGPNSTALAINNAGLIAGWSDVLGDARRHATLWISAMPVDVNSLLDAATVGAGWVLLDAAGINDSGWITGTAYNSVSDEMRGYLLSIPSVPEPGTFVMLLVGLGALSLPARRRAAA